MRAVLLISHGSRYQKTVDEIAILSNALKERKAADIVEFAFLELAAPSIPEGIDICAEKGATEILILLNFLNAGRHVDVDIPDIIEESQKKHPGVSIRISKPVGQHDRIVDLFLDIIKSS
ncbi:MAG: CbiX/SirB N-terminal domain-containing protein [Candidatus Omnitrophica bacterium]|nr:CbiX/SirB N-terminal domain-containing protein [Candidatus Omnitrophota bacterium]